MSHTNLGEVFAGGATTSQHIDAEDDAHFENTTFKLKRTRSLGLLDEFIDPAEQERKILENQNSTEESNTGYEDGAIISSDTHTSYFDGSNPSDNTYAYGEPSPEHGTIQRQGDHGTSLRKSISPETASETVDSPSFLKSPDLIPHDDSDLVAEPLRHVDYLLHKWDVSDISKSWRYVILRRKDVANAARLENASWRTWAQRRSNLKTISPEEVNWSKESDVTWLYGPIMDDEEHEPDDQKTFSTTTNAVAGDISIARKPSGPKPILKKRTVGDMMISHSNLLKLQLATARAELQQKRREDAEYAARTGDSTRPPEYFDYDVISAKLNSQYKNFLQPNLRAGSANNSVVDLTARSKNLTKPLQSLMSRTEPLVVKEKRHIQFNDVVEQCVALAQYLDDDDLYDEEYYDSEDEADDTISLQNDDDDDDDDDDDEGGFFLKVRSPLLASLAGFSLPGLTSTTRAHDDIDTQSIASASSVKTIQLLPPTTLNYGSSDEESDECNPYTSSMSHNVNNNSSRGYDYFYDYNTVYQVDPNHAIYGTNAKSTAPDVVDVPDNIAMGLSFDYEIIENNDPALDDPMTMLATPDKERLPISSLDDSSAPSEHRNPFSLGSDSESDSESDDGLLISARNSSQSLAQQVFSQGFTAAHYPAHEPEPENNHISSINPRYSSTALSKQPHSSNSLSDQFFSGTAMTEASSTGLADLFFNSKPEPKQSDMFSGTVSPPVQRKASPLPPHTTSANAFLGTTTPPLAKQVSKKSFIFDSESESEDEDEQETLSTFGKSPDSYSSLYRVADRNGLTSPASEEENGSKKNVGQTMANFLGGWNKNTN